MRLKRYLIGFAALSTLAGCATYDPIVPVSAMNGRFTHDIEVVEDTEVMEIVASAAEPGLPYYKQREVRYFLSQYNQRGRRHGPLIVSVPQGSPHYGSYQTSVQQMMDIAAEYGIRDIQRADYNSNGAQDAPMVLAFTSYRAIAPDCPSMATVNMAATSSNDPPPTFGCAMQANLAAMISDPADLLGARRSDPGDTLRRIEVLDRYRSGQPTATERSDAESGAVSTAVE